MSVSNSSPVFEAPPSIPKSKEELLKWNGWGYKDSYFYLDDDNNAKFAGSRYESSGKVLPHMVKWMESVMGIDVNYKVSANELDLTHIPASRCDSNFLEGIRGLSNVTHSDAPIDRLMRAHGHTLYEVYTLNHGMFDRIPDLVVWPECHDAVVEIVRLADRHDAVLIPFGGGTSVTEALLCPSDERRTIVTVDMSQMNKILWVDRKNLTLCAEAGIIGQDLERRMTAMGYCTGHEPDSVEFSSLGGWVATRASGMKKSIYGNIEDLLVHARLVTPRGVLEKSTLSPRTSMGPDVHHLILGSEGSLGIITQVTLRMRPLPEVTKYASLVFKSFPDGVACLRELANRQCFPASIRLMDNDQFKFGHAVKPGTTSWYQSFVENIKKVYLTRIRGFDVDKLCVATLLFEGGQDQVKLQEQQVNGIAAEFGGLPAGEENGKRGYMLTFAIAYLRDVGLEYYCVGESFETSVPWDRVLHLCRNVKDRVRNESAKAGIVHPVFVSCRVTQSYDCGACVYFYFGFNYRGINDPVSVYAHVETAARTEVLASGGSLSHHHGIGKIRKKWLPEAISDVGMEALLAVKQRLDPNNIFGNQNLLPSSKL